MPYKASKGFTLYKTAVMRKRLRLATGLREIGVDAGKLFKRQPNGSYLPRLRGEKESSAALAAVMQRQDRPETCRMYLKRDNAEQSQTELL